MTGLFAQWQPRYAEHGIATFPVREKRPVVRGYLKLGAPTSARLTERFSDVDALGFTLGGRNKITVLDIDTPDQRILAEALDQYGQTPVVVCSGSGNYQAWYRHNGERRKIRPFPGKPIDVLGEGFVVAPPSRGTKSNYEFIEGNLDDLDRLPTLRGIEFPTPSQVPTASLADKVVVEGFRNHSLWRHCMASARYCDGYDALLDAARSRNEEFLPPLVDTEVMKIAKSAWGYTQRGANRFGRHGVFFDTDEANHLIGTNQDVFLLLAFLRANNGPERTFLVANGLAKQLGWTRKRLADARRRLQEKHIAMVRPPTTFNGPALYRWRKSRTAAAGVFVEDRWSELATLT